MCLRDLLAQLAQEVARCAAFPNLRNVAHLSDNICGRATRWRLHIDIPDGASSELPPAGTFTSTTERIG